MNPATPRVVVKRLCCRLSLTRNDVDLDLGREVLNGGKTTHLRTARLGEDLCRYSVAKALAALSACV